MILERAIFVPVSGLRAVVGALTRAISQFCRTRDYRQRGAAGNAPNTVGDRFGRPAAAICQILARPFEPPFSSFHRCNKRLRYCLEYLVVAEVDDQQQIVTLRAEITQQEDFVAQRRTIEPPRPRSKNFAA